MTTSTRWSSKFAFNLAAIGAAVGLGSVWRFPYLAGASGGSAFIFVFIVACLGIAAPLLIAEYMIGKSARLSPPQAAGAIAARFGASHTWNAIGHLGMWSSVVIMSYYTIIAGWVMAYAWKCGSGELTALARPQVSEHFHAFLSHPLEIGAWQMAFIALIGAVSAFGLSRGVEIATKIRAPGLLVLLLLLVGYSLENGKVHEGLAFAFAPHFERLSGPVILAAVGQAFFATGVGMGMMLAYGAYIPEGTSLSRSALVVCFSIIAVSMLATLMIFPLVYAYGLNPAQGPDLVFNVLPIAFGEMSGGRLIGTLFFILLLLSALTPSLAGLEPLVAWLQQSRRLSRPAASFVGCLMIWGLGIGSVLSFNVWADFRPLRLLPRLRSMTIFDVLDFFASNILLTAGALLTCLFIGWRLPAGFAQGELAREGPLARTVILALLRFACPLAVLAVLLTTLFA